MSITVDYHMTEQVAREYIRVPNIPESMKESLSRGDLLWEDGETKMVYPENPLVPKEEGIHIRVASPGVPVHPQTPDQWHAWCRHWAKMIGAAKVVSEGMDLGDMWQSLVGASEYTPQDHLVTDIIGRNPKGKSWGATAPFPEPGYRHQDHRIEAARGLISTHP